MKSSHRDHDHSASAITIPSHNVNPTQLLWRNAARQASRSRSRMIHCCQANNPAVTASASQYGQPRAERVPTSNMVSRKLPMSTPMMTRSASAKRIAVDFAPALMSSSRSTIAYSVSYSVDHRMLPMNSNHATGGTLLVTAAKAMGIDQPNAAPSTTWGRWVYRLVNGYRAASAAPANESRMVSLLVNSTSTKENASSTAKTTSASRGVTRPLAIGRPFVRATSGSSLRSA